MTIFPIPAIGRLLRARRHPTFKTYAAIAGMRHGFSLRSRLEGNAFTPDGDSTEVHNENDRNYGTVSLRQAIAKSINTAFVDDGLTD